jgi:hypothetical protein
MVFWLYAKGELKAAGPEGQHTVEFVPYRTITLRYLLGRWIVKPVCHKFRVDS